MRDFNGGRSSGGFGGRSSGGFGGGSRGGFGGGRDRGGDRQMFDAVCAECGDDCKIPFAPKTDKPVFCSSCFEKMGGGEPREPRSNSRGGFSGGRDSSSAKPDNALSGKMDLLISKMDRMLDILSKNNSTEKVEEKKSSKKEKVEEPVEEKEVKEKKTVKKVAKKTSKK